MQTHNEWENGETIMLDGKEVKVYLCDQRAKCHNSNMCGNLCKFTLEAEHEQKQMLIFDLESEND